jgi:hypothetical protein
VLFGPQIAAQILCSRSAATSRLGRESLRMERPTVSQRIRKAVFRPQSRHGNAFEAYLHTPKGKRMEHSSIYPGLCRFDCQGYNVGVFLQPEVETVEVFRISPLRE